MQDHEDWWNVARNVISYLNLQHLTVVAGNYARVGNSYLEACGLTISHFPGHQSNAQPDILYFTGQPDHEVRQQARPLLKACAAILCEAGGADACLAEQDDFEILLSGPLLLLLKREALPAVANLELPTPRWQELNAYHAIEYQRRGWTWQAEQIYRRLLTQEPTNARIMHLLGVTFLQRQQYIAALHWLEQAVQRMPQSAIFRNNYGAALLGLGRLDDAGDQFSQAVAIRPSYADALSNLAVIWQKRGHDQQTEHFYRAALTVDPRHLDSLQQYARWLTQKGRRELAIRYWKQAIELRPRSASLHGELGDALVLDHQVEPAVNAYQRALALDAEQPRIHFNLGVAFAELERTTEAKQHLQAACRMRPAKSAWRLREMLICPTVLESETAIDEYQGQLSQHLDDLIANPPQVKLQDLVNVGFHPPFPLAFQGREHRPLKEKFAALARKWVQPLNASPAPGKPRIGFVVTRGHEGIFLRCLAGIIEGLDSQQLDVVLLCPQSSELRLRQELHSPHLEWHVFREEIVPAVETIARAGCHVLYYWEVGTDSLNYLLPFFRLAPLQVTAWGTQVTTGSHEVDYYLSSQLIETADAQRHYTEKLHCFQTLPTYQRRVPVVEKLSRSRLGLPNDRPVYLCPQTILKLHPQQDALFADVLQADPRGVLVLKEGRFERPNQILQARLQMSLGKLYERVIFVPWQPQYEDYLRLIQAADVILDTHHFSAGSTSYDFFSYGEPIVTWPGEWNIGRYILGCYRKMGIEELIASSSDEYAALATRVAQDKAYQQLLRERLRAQVELLFNDEQAIQEHQAFFLEVSHR